MWRREPVSGARNAEAFFTGPDGPASSIGCAYDGLTFRGGVEPDRHASHKLETWISRSSPEVSNVETIAVGARIRERKRLIRQYGAGRWRKRKGIARLRLADGTARLAELHGYEAHGLGRHEFKIKGYLD